MSPYSLKAYFFIDLFIELWLIAIFFLNKLCFIDSLIIWFKFLFRLADPHRLDKEKTRPSIITNWSIYTINDKVALDFIGRYENLEKDLEKIENIIGVKLDINSIWSKSNIRKKNKSIAEYYDEQSIELVRQIYKKEIEEFNYKIPF